MARDCARAAAIAATLAVSLLAAGPAGAAGRTPSDLPPVSAGDVVLYIDDEPCSDAAEVAEVAVQQADMSLAAVMRALRLEAAHRNANAVKDIRVAPGPEGKFRVSGMAIRCPAAGAPAEPAAPSETAPQPRPRGMPQPRSEIDPQVMQFLGRNFIGVIQGADRVESFHLAGRGAGKNAVQDFAVTGKGRDLSAGQIARLRGLILDAHSYMFGTSKRCPFLADAGFVVHRGDDRASVALATHCNLWSFAPAGDGARPAIEDFDPAAPALKALVAEVLGP